MSERVCVFLFKSDFRVLSVCLIFPVVD